MATSTASAGLAPRVPVGELVIGSLVLLSDDRPYEVMAAVPMHFAGVVSGPGRRLTLRPSAGGKAHRLALLDDAELRAV